MLTSLGLSERVTRPLLRMVLRTIGFALLRSLKNCLMADSRGETMPYWCVSSGFGLIASVSTRPTAALGRLILNNDENVAAISTGATTP